MLYLALRLIHVLFMATWVGAVLFFSGDVRRTLAAGPEHLPLLRDRLARCNRLAGLSALVTIATGVGLILVLGGFGAVPSTIHSGFLGGLILLGVGGGGIGRTWQQIDGRLQGGADPATLSHLVRRLDTIAILFHTIWLLVLCLMVFRNAMG